MERDSDVDGLAGRARTRIGQRLRGKWRLDALLGVGGMAAVYAATHRNGKRVAIKVLHAEVALSDDARRRFLREGYVANSVEHKGAVSVLDDDVTEDGAPFVVMDLFEGETLDQRLRRKGKLEPEDVLATTHHLLDVLAAAHDRGVIHRDVKPENVFLTRDDGVKVLDFGIAQLRELSGRAGATRIGHTMGTPAFMPPEQARGRWDEVDGRSDVWAVGATMFLLLTGRHVHEAETVNEILLAAMQTPAKSIALFRPDLPAPVVGVVDRALAFERAERWPSARAMQAAVAEAYAAIGRTPTDWARVPTLAATSVSTPPAPQSLEPRSSTTARPVARTAAAERTLPAWSRGVWGVGVAAGVAFAIAGAALASRGLEPTRSAAGAGAPAAAAAPTLPIPAESPAPPAPSAAPIPGVPPVDLSAAASMPRALPGPATPVAEVRARTTTAPAPAPRPSTSPLDRRH